MKTLDLDHFRHFWAEDVAALKSCVQQVLSDLARNALNLSISPDVTPGGHDYDEMIEWHAERKWLLSEVYPTIIKKSLFTAIYTAFEKFLTDIADFVAEHRPHAIERKDLRSKGVEQIRDYLKKVQSFTNFPDQTKEWQTILGARDVRNSLVHSEGVVVDPSKLKLIQKFSEDHIGWLTIEDEKHVIPTQEGCFQLLATIEGFGYALLDAVDPDNQKRFLALLSEQPI